jgi:HYR domain
VTIQRFISRNGSDVLLETLVDQGPVNCCDPPSGGFDYSGTKTFEDLQPGDVYGFRLGGSNADGLKVLQGSLELHEVDSTPPVVTPQITGSLGEGGFYTGPATVKWLVSDDGSRISAVNGCGDVTVSDDTAGTDITCAATSRGGTTSRTVTLKKDTTAPELKVPVVIVQQAAAAEGMIVSYDATATDAIDPAPVIACTPASATLFPVGTTTVSCTARDAAGNKTSKTFDTIVLAPAPIATPTVTPRPSGAVLKYRYAVKQRKTHLTHLELRNAAAGLTVTVTCKGKKCPKALKGSGKVLKSKGSALNLTSLVRSPLLTGTRIVVSIAGPSIVTTIKTLVIRTGKAPTSGTTCLQPGATKPTAC